MRRRRFVAVLFVACVSALATTVGIASADAPAPPYAAGAIPMPVADMAAAKMPVVYQTHHSKLQTSPAPKQGTKGPEPIPNLVISSESKTKKGWALCRIKGSNVKAFYCPVFPSLASTRVQQGWLDVVRCGVAIGAFIAGNVALIAKVKKMGGVYKAARKIFSKRRKGESKAAHRERIATAVLGVFGEITGADQVIEKCGVG